MRSGKDKMKKKLIKCVFAAIVIFCFCAGCASEKNVSESTFEDNSVSSSETDTKSQSENNSTSNELSETGETEKPLNGNVPDTIEPGESKNDANTFSVVFQDAEGNVLKTEEIQKGEDATPPEEPEKDGYQFVGWNYDYEDVQTDITVVPVFEEITEPTLVVKKVTAKAGDKVEVPISLQNNPGFLGMVVNIQYNEDALTLTEVSNGSLLEGYMFTPPKNMKSGCNAAWNITDIPEDIDDGEILVLHFKVSDKTHTGTYSVSVSCLNDAYDESFHAFSFDSIQGCVNVK